MKLLIFLVLCIVGATISDSSPVNGPQTSIVNGLDVQPATNSAFHAHIHLRVTGNDIQVASGVFIGDRWVLTVAQNLQDNLDLLRCGFGNTNRELLQWVDAEQYFRHPDYNGPILANNIGLILLISNPTSATIIPIAMATPQTPQGDGFVGLLFGFGFTTNEGIFALHLQQATKTIQTNAVCAATYPHLTNRLDTEFCALGIAEIGTPSACSGDQGGPFSISNILIGLHSFNRNGNCFSGQPAAFVRVSAYRSWITLMTGLFEV